MDADRAVEVYVNAIQPEVVEDSITPIAPQERVRHHQTHRCERCGCVIPIVKRRWCSACSSIRRYEMIAEARRRGHDER